MRVIVAVVGVFVGLATTAFVASAFETAQIQGGAGSIGAGTLTGSQLANGTVTGTQLANPVVVSSADWSVTMEDNDDTAWCFGSTGNTSQLCLATTDSAEEIVASRFFSALYDAPTAVGTTQADCYQLTANYNSVTTAANAGVCLPCTAHPGCVQIVTGATNATKVYGCIAVAASADTVDGAAEATGVSQAASTDAVYCTANGVAWVTMRSESTAGGGVATSITTAADPTAFTSTAGDVDWALKTADVDALTINDGATAMVRLDTSADQVVFGVPTASPVTTIAAAGSDQASATAIPLTAEFILVYDGAGGVRLPALSSLAYGRSFWIQNYQSTPLSVYPASGQFIASLAANLPAILTSNEGALIKAYNSTSWLGSTFPNLFDNNTMRSVWGIRVSGGLSTHIVTANTVAAFQVSEKGTNTVLLRANTTTSGHEVISSAFHSLTYAPVTAGTTQTQAGCTQLVSNVNRVTTGTANDGVCLPCTAGAGCVRVKNISANALQVYGCKAVATETDTVDAQAENTGVSQLATVDALYCTPAVSGTTSAWITW
jgi:hypothetical protein